MKGIHTPFVDKICKDKSANSSSKRGSSKPKAGY